MVGSGETSEPNPRTLAEISALADGTLDPGRAPAVHELIAASPELSRRYELERRAVEALHTLRADRAPARLRLGLEARRRPAPRPRGRLVYGGGLAVAVAGVVAALVLLLPGGSPGAPSVSQAATLAVRGPALPAPMPDSAHPGSKLRQDVEDVYFPNWSGWFGWRAVGQRIDRLGGRLAVTVYYERAGHRIAYTILALPPLRWPGSGTHTVDGTTLQSATVHGRLVVTWRRAGHTCVLSGAGVSTAELSRLAAWQAPGLRG
jgi:hypothetical protein